MVIHTRTAKVLLMRRIEPADFWQSVTGSLRWDETSAEQAARREVFEETGLQCGDALRDLQSTARFGILPAWRQRYAPGVGHNLEHHFSLLLDEAVSIRLDPCEHSEYVWLDAAAALERATSSSNQSAIRLLHKA